MFANAQPVQIIRLSHRPVPFVDIVCAVPALFDGVSAAGFDDGEDAAAVDEFPARSVAHAEVWSGMVEVSKRGKGERRAERGRGIIYGEEHAVFCVSAGFKQRWREVGIA